MFDVITIGSAVGDVFLSSQKIKVIQDARFITGQAECMALGSKIELDGLEITTGGGATNNAVSIARKGFSTACVIRVADDVTGRQIKDVLQDEGVSAKFVQTDESDAANSGYSVIIIAPGGGRTVLTHRGVSKEIDGDAIQWSDLTSKWFHISSLGGDLDLLERLLGHAELYNIRVAFNPGSKDLQNKDRLLPLLKKVNVLFLNKEEGSMLTGVDFKDMHGILRNLFNLTKELVVMTDGGDGLSAFDGNVVYRAGVFREGNIADRTGAGDAFGSGFVSALAGVDYESKLTPEIIKNGIRVGSANATSVVEFVGAKKGLLTKEQLQVERWKELEVEEGSMSYS